MINLGLVVVMVAMGSTGPSESGTTIKNSASVGQGGHYNNDNQ
jgi:hypothetical protein